MSENTSKGKKKKKVTEQRRTQNTNKTGEKFNLRLGGETQTLSVFVLRSPSRYPSTSHNRPPRVTLHWPTGSLRSDPWEFLIRYPNKRALFRQKGLSFGDITRYSDHHEGKILCPPFPWPHGGKSYLWKWRLGETLGRWEGDTRPLGWKTRGTKLERVPHHSPRREMFLPSPLNPQLTEEDIWNWSRRTNVRNGGETGNDWTGKLKK